MCDYSELEDQNKTDSLVEMTLGSHSQFSHLPNWNPAPPFALLATAQELPKLET